MVKSAKATMNQVSDTIGHLETELKTNEEYKSKVVHEIETRGQEVIDMIKNATEAMIKIVNENESNERTRIVDEIGQRTNACSYDTVIISKANKTTNGGNAVTLLSSVVDIETNLKCSKYLDRSNKEVQQTRFLKSLGKSKEVEALIGSLTVHEDKDDHTKPIRTMRDIKIGDRVRLKAGTRLKYGDAAGVESEDSIGDTTFEVFLNPPTDDLLKVKLLITETTYIDEEQGKNMMQKARDRGHIHIQELAYYAYLFENVENILLIHFSDKYSPNYIQNTVRQKLPDSLVDKVHVATVAKEKYG